MNGNKGTALIITLVYLIVVTIICVSVLGFSSGHYRLMSYRVDRMQNLYYAEGGLYMGLVGTRGAIYIQPGNNEVNITEGANLESKRHFDIEY